MLLNAHTLQRFLFPHAHVNALRHLGQLVYACGTRRQAVCDDLYGKLQAKEKEMQEYQAKHNIRLRNQPDSKAK
jgi:predicted mannosyl-3-phosphoglycerate phosphatase (HAD superfamily)